ncbi:hypothetical protein BH11MYX1_BH11MYX1_01060 [soil metagenome]
MHDPIVRERLLVAALVGVGCGRIGFAAEPADGGQVEAAVPLGPWGNVHIIGELADAGSKDDPTLSMDELELFFTTSAMGGPGSCDVWTSTRPALGATWSPATPLDGAVNSIACESSPELAPDGLTLWFSSSRLGSHDLYEAHRATRASPWQVASEVVGVNSQTNDLGPTVTADQLTLVFYSDRAGTNDLYVATRSVVTAPWGAPTIIAELTSDADERSPHLAYDGKTLWFVSTAAGSQDPYVGVKEVDGRFDSHRIDELSTAVDDDDPWVSRDEHRIYFARDRVGSPSVSDLMMADR